MALEKQSKEGALSGMPAKQKAMIVAVVVIFLVIAWQVVGLMGGIGGGSTSAPTVPAVTKPVSAQNSKTQGMMPPSKVNASSASMGEPAQQTELKQGLVGTDPRLAQ